MHKDALIEKAREIIKSNGLIFLPSLISLLRNELVNLLDKNHRGMVEYNFEDVLSKVETVRIKKFQYTVIDSNIVMTAFYYETE